MSVTRTLGLPGNVEIDMILDDVSEFMGLGGVRVGGVALRSASTPIRLRCDTPDGILYTRLLLDAVHAEADGSTRIELKAVGLPWARGEYCDEYNQPLTFPTLSPGKVSDRIALILRPSTLELGGRTWTGFSYAVEFRSDARRIHRFMVHATWELGGAIAGNTLLHQGQCNMPVYRGSRDAPFTTTCLKTLDRYGDPQGVSYQLAPRGGLIQAFDFQHASPGALLMFWPRFEAVSSHLDSPAGCDLLHVIDENRFDLTHHAHVPEKHVLFCPGPIAEHEARDLWWHAYEHVYGGIKAQAGVEETRVLPEVGLRYSTRVSPTGLKMTVAGREVDSQEVPYAIGDLVLPLLAAAGVRRFFPEVMSESDVTQIGFRRKVDAGIHGDLHCASVCATHRFRPAEFWGGMKAWGYMAQKAKALGIELGAWFAPHFSPSAPIYAEHPEYRMIGVNSSPDGGGYGFNTIVVADWNTPIRQWVFEDLKRWKEEGGLDYLFTDSWANMGLLQANYSQRMRTNFAKLGELYADLQRIGIKSHSFEGISPFGYSRFGVADLRGEAAEARPGIVGQNDFGWWVGEEDMAFNLCPMVAHGQRRGEEKWHDVQFRIMAGRGTATFEHLYDDHYRMPGWWVGLNHIYLQALPHMKVRRTLPGGAGVAWTDRNVEVVWAFRELPLPVAGAALVEEIRPEGPRALAGGRAAARSVVRITR